MNEQDKSRVKEELSKVAVGLGVLSIAAVLIFIAFKSPWWFLVALIVPLAAWLIGNLVTS